MTTPAVRPLVSVVLPTRDRAASLARAIDSVLAQTYSPVELIVVDDGSTDDTATVLRQYADDVTVLTLPGEGVYPARNLALRHARGELVAFLDSDDVWGPDKLAVQVPLLQRADTALVYGDALHVCTEPRGRPRTSFQTTPPHRGRIAAQLAWGNCVPTITVLARRTSLEEAGLFPTSHPTSADYVMWLRIALRHRVDYVPAVVADYTVHSGGISADLGTVLLDRIELFSAELLAATDAETRRILRRVVFTLSLGVVLGVLRGRIRPRRPALHVAWAGLKGTTVPDAVRCTAMLVLTRSLRALRPLAGRQPC